MTTDSSLPPRAFDPLFAHPVGTKIGQLTVIGLGRRASPTEWLVRVRCDCGVETEKHVAVMVRSGDKAYCRSPEHQKVIRKERRQPQPEPTLPPRSKPRPPRAGYRFEGQVIGKVRVIRRISLNTYEVICLACQRISTMDYHSLRHEVAYGQPRTCLECAKAIKKAWAKEALKVVRGRKLTPKPSKRAKKPVKKPVLRLGVIS